jgi:hypothetical protein
LIFLKVPNIYKSFWRSKFENFFFLISRKEKKKVFRLYFFVFPSIRKDKRALTSLKTVWVWNTDQQEESQKARIASRAPNTKSISKNANCVCLLDQNCFLLRLYSFAYLKSE